MKKRLFSALLALGLCLSLMGGAWAEETKPVFSDVPDGSWYQEGAVICARNGIMIGTAEGVFSPSTELTAAQCLTLALRLFDLQMGGESRLLTAPVDWQGVPTGSWWRDTVYSVQAEGLDNDVGFSPLYDQVVNQGGNTLCSRYTFAVALNEAAGQKMPVLHENVTIPDLDRAGSSAGIYRLYASGILNGMDETGAFFPDKSLTRAEAATMVARVLEPTLRIGAREDTPSAEPSQPPAPSSVSQLEVEIDRTFTSYAAAVAELRSKTGHSNEKIYEAPDCDIYVFDRGGFMNAPKGMMVAIYKEGSALGEGASITLPYARAQALMVCTPADTVELSADKTVFTYTYTFDEPLVIEGVIRRAAGTFTYTFDTAAGKVTLNAPDASTAAYAQAMADLLSRGATVEQTLEGAAATALLVYAQPHGVRDYTLYLVDKETGEARQAILPSTQVLTLDDGSLYTPTHRAPDSLALSEDNTQLVYVYQFDQPLTGGKTTYHAAGSYTYTVDLATGELSAVHTEA